jgi:hypothetical protein
MLTEAWDMKVAADKAKAGGVQKTCELSLSCESAVIVGRWADALLLKRSAKLQELRLVIGLVCPSLSSNVDRVASIRSPAGAT